MTRTLLAVIYFCICFPASAAPVCPSEFPQFLERFGADRTFQESHIQYPLRYISHQGKACYPDCPVIEHKLSRQKISALSEPIFPLQTKQLAVPVEVKVKITRNHAVVRMDKPESDSYSFEFRFARSKTCWLLVSAQDLSL